MKLLVALFVLGVATPVRADDANRDAIAERAFRAAEVRSEGAIDAFEALGAERPQTRWTDDAWSEAARLAERSGDYARARRDLEQVLAVPGVDEALARRARGSLARIAAFAGDAGQWSQLADAHDRWVGEIQHGGGDPRFALVVLGALIAVHPGYPRAAAAMVVLARGWESEGELEQAHAWLVRAAVPAELARFAIRTDDLATAAQLIATVTPAELANQLTGELALARSRRTTRWILWAALASIAAAAAVSIRRGAGSWVAAARLLVRPPAEVIFFVPIAIVLVIVATTGNPLVAHAVRSIAIAGALIAWVSGARLEATRRRRGAVGLRGAVIHAALAAIAVAASSYLALGRGAMLDLVAETWRAGPGA